MTEQEKLYMKWLLNSVLIECHTTAWCAAQMGWDADEVEKDFNRYLRKRRNQQVKSNRFTLPPR